MLTDPGEGVKNQEFTQSNIVEDDTQARGKDIEEGKDPESFEDTKESDEVDPETNRQIDEKPPLFLHHTLWKSKDKDKVKPIDFDEYERIQALTRHPQKRFDHVYIKAKLKALVNKPNVFKDNMIHKYCRFCDEYLPISEFHPSQIRKVCKAHFRQIINFDLYKRYMRDPFEYPARIISLLYCNNLKFLYGYEHGYEDEKVYPMLQSPR